MFFSLMDWKRKSTMSWKVKRNERKFSPLVWRINERKKSNSVAHSSPILGNKTLGFWWEGLQSSQKSLEDLCSFDLNHLFINKIKQWRVLRNCNLKNLSSLGTTKINRTMWTHVPQPLWTRSCSCSWWRWPSECMHEILIVVNPFP